MPKQIIQQINKCRKENKGQGVSLHDLRRMLLNYKLSRPISKPN